MYQSSTVYTYREMLSQRQPTSVCYEDCIYEYCKSQQLYRPQLYKVLILLVQLDTEWQEL